jgi:hypothetical protein
MRHSAWLIAHTLSGTLLVQRADALREELADQSPVQLVTYLGGMKLDHRADKCT